MNNVLVTANLSHDASVCVFKDGNIIYFNQEERLSHVKHSAHYVWRTLDFVLNNYDVDELHLAYLNPEYEIEHLLNEFKIFLTECYTANINKIFAYHDHHIFHAYNSVYDSSFEECAVLVIDGNGKFLHGGFREQESIFTFKNNNLELVHQYNRANKKDSIGMSLLWEKVSEYFFGDWYNAGKLMGASAYGEDNPNHPKAYVNGQGNIDFLNSVHEGKISFEDASYRLQNDSFDVVCDLVEKVEKLTNHKNICLTGGYFQNCVNNFNLVKKYPHLNFYVDPLSTDAGISIGLGKMILKNASKGLETLYLGNQANYEKNLRKTEKEYKVTPKEVAEILSNKNIVALYQGRSEAGHRALGNRSILYDPRDPNGRDHVNRIKKREYYRPFAGTVMLEHAHDWFDMASLKESPFMMFAVNTKPEKLSLVPALQHNDGSSRIQTVTKEQNENYYNLIKEFYVITGIPMVLNTSFNLAGDTLVDNMDDALKTCREAKIKYLYCPEKELMVEL